MNGLFIALSKVRMHKRRLVTSVLLLYWHACIKRLAALQLLKGIVVKNGSTRGVMTKKLSGSYHGGAQSGCITLND